MTSPGRLPDKQKHQVRRRHHIARDLALPKFRQQVKEGKKPEIDDHDWEEEVDEFYHPEDYDDEEFIIDAEE